GLHRPVLGARRPRPPVVAVAEHVRCPQRLRRRVGPRAVLAAETQHARRVLRQRHRRRRRHVHVVVVAREPLLRRVRHVDRVVPQPPRPQHVVLELHVVAVARHLHRIPPPLPHRLVHHRPRRPRAPLPPLPPPPPPPPAAP